MSQEARQGAQGESCPKEGCPPPEDCQGRIRLQDLRAAQFKLPAHLARQATASHGKARKVRNVGRPAGRRAAIAAPGALDVKALTVDQLLTLKEQVDDRLSDIVRRMRAAKVRV